MSLGLSGKVLISFIWSVIWASGYSKSLGWCKYSFYGRKPPRTHSVSNVATTHNFYCKSMILRRARNVVKPCYWSCLLLTWLFYFKAFAKHILTWFKLWNSGHASPLFFSEKNEKRKIRNFTFWLVSMNFLSTCTYHPLFFSAFSKW